MKTLLYGDGGWLFDVENEPVPELVLQLSTCMLEGNLLNLLVYALHSFEFEAKKDAAQIYNNLLRRQVGTGFPIADYIGQHQEILFTLIKGYENPDISLNCGMILRECLRHEHLCKVVLESPHFWAFFGYVELSSFDVASDAFASFKDCLTKHKTLVSDYLTAHYDTVQ